MENPSHWAPPSGPTPQVLYPSPVAAPTAVTAPSGPLSAEHLQQLAEANLRAKKLRSAGGVAMFNGIAIGIFSGISLLCGLVELALDGFDVTKLDWLTVVMGAGLGLIAWNELRCRRRLRQFDPRGPRGLGLNQLCLLGLIVAYSAWMIGVALLGPNPYDEIIRKEPLAANMLGSLGELYRNISIAIYGAMILGTLLFQGINSLYYFTRVSVLRRYLAQTPAWVIELQQCQAGGFPPRSR